MKYINRSFTMPTTNKNISKLEYDLRVGNITQEEYDQIQSHGVDVKENDVSMSCE